MKVCRVVGNLWSTKKDEGLEGVKLMIVQTLYGDAANQNRYVAADFVGAGIGETVLVVTGSTAHNTSRRPTAPIDAAIVGIVDSQELSE